MTKRSLGNNPTAGSRIRGRPPLTQVGRTARRQSLHPGEKAQSLFGQKGQGHDLHGWLVYGSPHMDMD